MRTWGAYKLSSVLQSASTLYFDEFYKNLFVLVNFKIHSKIIATIAIIAQCYNKNSPCPLSYALNVLPPFFEKTFSGFSHGCRTILKIIVWGRGNTVFLPHSTQVLRMLSARRWIRSRRFFVVTFDFSSLLSVILEKKLSGSLDENLLRKKSEVTTPGLDLAKCPKKLSAVFLNFATVSAKSFICQTHL